MKKLVAQPWLFVLLLAISGCILLITFGAESLYVFPMFVVLPAAPVLMLNIIAMIVHWRKKSDATNAAVTGFNIGLIVVITLSTLHILLAEIINVNWGYGYMVAGVLAVIACIGFAIGILSWLIMYSQSHLLKSCNNSD